MSEELPQNYEFGPFRLDPSKQLLFRDGIPVSLTPKLFDTLRALVERHGEQITKDELMKAVWGDSIVEETNLTTNVSNLRRLLGEKKNDHHYILTIPGEGYRFVAQVKRVSLESVEGLVHERTLTRVTIEEPTVSSGLNYRRQLILASVALIVLVVAGYVLYRNRAQPLPGSSELSIKSIAVLPFKPLVEQNRDDLLELGIADSLITRLSSLKHVEVRPISAVRGYTRLDQDVRTAGSELRVDAVLDGSIQKSGERIKVTVRLLNLNTGEQLWSDSFDEKFNDLFRVQESISIQVAGAIAKVTAGEKQLLAKRYTDNFEAYNLYTRGRFFWHKRSAEAVTKSIECFQQAIARDPNYALAYAGLADAYAVSPGLTKASTLDSYAKAKAFALKAIELDNQLTEPYVTLAALAADNWEWAEAEKQFKRAIELNPNYATAHQWYGEYLVHIGRLDEASSEFNRAHELDPTSVIINVLIGQHLYFQRRYDEAIHQYQLTLELDPNFATAHWLLGLAYLEKSMTEAAVSSLQKALDLSGGSSNLMALLAAAYGRSGNRTVAHDLINNLSAQPVAEGERARNWAIFYTGVGDKEKAFEWLEKALAERSELLLFMRVDPFFDSLRSDPRFGELLRRVGP